MTLKDSIGLLAAERRHIAGLLRSRPCLASKLAIVAGLAYLLGPIDLIPARVPYFGHADDVAVVLLSLAAARWMLPDSVAPERGRAWLADALTAWLMLRRNLHRAGQKLGRARAGDGTSWRQAPDARTKLFRLVGYRAWWRARSLLRRPAVSHAPVIVIGGAARSGTTLLRTLLGRHPHIASGPETTVFLARISSPHDIAERMGWQASEIEAWQMASRNQVDFLGFFERAMLDRSGKRIWAEKTPHNVGRFAWIRRRFPRARLVHIVRDGRDTVCSLRVKPFAKLDGGAWNSVAGAQRCAIQWRNSVRPGLRFRGDPAYHELRYEELVQRPEATLRALLIFLDLPWSDDMLRPAGQPPPADADERLAAAPIFNSSIGRWRRDLSPAEKKATGALIGPLLDELGYEDAENSKSPRQM